MISIRSSWEEKFILDRPGHLIHFPRSGQGAALRSCDVMQLNLKKVKKNSKKKKPPCWFPVGRTMRDPALQKGRRKQNIDR
jgi:hypothetical protein